MLFCSLEYRVGLTRLLLSGGDRLYDVILRVMGNVDASSDTICLPLLLPDRSALCIYFLALCFEPILFGKDNVYVDAIPMYPLDAHKAEESKFP